MTRLSSATPTFTYPLGHVSAWDRCGNIASQSPSANMID